MQLQIQKKIEGALRPFLFKTVTDDLKQEMLQKILEVSASESEDLNPPTITADAFHPVGYKLTKGHKMSFILENMSKTERRLEPVPGRIYSRRIAARILKRARGTITFDIKASFPPVPEKIEICGVISKD